MRSYECLEKKVYEGLKILMFGVIENSRFSSMTSNCQSPDSGLEWEEEMEREAEGKEEGEEKRKKRKGGGKGSREKGKNQGKKNPFACY